MKFAHEFASQQVQYKYEQIILGKVGEQIKRYYDCITPYVSIETILRHPSIRWNWKKVSESIDIHMCDVVSYPDLPWYPNAISSNPSIMLEDVLSNPEFPWVWEEVSRNPSVTLDDIKKHPNLPWDWRTIWLNPNITLEFAQNNRDRLVKYLYKNSYYSWLTLDILIDLGLESSLGHVCNFIKLKPSDVEQLPHLPWNYDELSSNPHISFELVLKTSDKLWNYSKLSANPVITIDIVEKYPNIHWCFKSLSKNPNVTLEFVLRNLTKVWDWSFLSKHPNITFDDMKENSNLFWSMEHISMNPNVSLDVIQENPNYFWNWNVLLRRKFEKQRTELEHAIASKMEQTQMFKDELLTKIAFYFSTVHTNKNCHKNVT